MSSDDSDCDGDDDEKPGERTGVCGDSDFPLCIICQDAASKNDGDYLAYLAFSQLSKVAVPKQQQFHLDPCKQRPEMNFSKDPSAAIIVQFCGHAMHYLCFETYYLTVVQKNEEQNGLILDTVRGQYQCPLCKQLNNMLVPYCAKDRKAVDQLPSSSFASETNCDWLNSAQHQQSDGYGTKSVSITDSAVADADKMISDDIFLESANSNISGRNNSLHSEQEDGSGSSLANGSGASFGTSMFGRIIRSISTTLSNSHSRALSAVSARAAGISISISTGSSRTDTTHTTQDKNKVDEADDLLFFDETVPFGEKDIESQVTAARFLQQLCEPKLGLDCKFDKLSIIHQISISISAFSNSAVADCMENFPGYHINSVRKGNDEYRYLHAAVDYVGKELEDLGLHSLFNEAVLCSLSGSSMTVGTDADSGSEIFRARVSLQKSRLSAARGDNEIRLPDLLVNPLLTQNLFDMLVTVCTIRDNQSDIRYAFRQLCVARMLQQIILCRLQIAENHSLSVGSSPVDFKRIKLEPDTEVEIDVGKGFNVTEIMGETKSGAYSDAIIESKTCNEDICSVESGIVESGIVEKSDLGLPEQLFELICEFFDSNVDQCLSRPSFNNKISILKDWLSFVLISFHILWRLRPDVLESVRASSTVKSGHGDMDSYSERETEEHLFMQCLNFDTSFDAKAFDSYLKMYFGENFAENSGPLKTFIALWFEDYSARWDTSGFPRPVDSLPSVDTVTRWTETMRPVPMRRSGLVALPDSYTQLHGEISKLTDIEYPALCLVCGCIINAGDLISILPQYILLIVCSEGTGKGECSRHALLCSPEASVFFLLQVFF